VQAESGMTAVQKKAEVPSRPEPRVFDRDFSASLTSSVNMDKIDGRKKNIGL